MSAQAQLWWASGAALCIAMVAAFAEHRRTRRRDLDRVGIMPWNFIQIIAFLGAILAAALALKA